MPWTFAHPAAVLPFRRLAALRWLSLSALVIGSLSPDFGYYIGCFALANIAHTPLGVFTLCVPTGLLVLFVSQRLHEPIANLLPQPHRAAVLALATARQSFDLRAFVVIAVSLALGAFTHLFWDSFTHEGRFFVKTFTFLREPLFTALNRQFRVFNIVQHVSTVIGVVCLAVVYARYARLFGALDELEIEDRRRVAVLATTLLSAVVVAFPFAQIDATDAVVQLDISKLVVREVIYATTAFYLLLSVVALSSRKQPDA